MAIKLSYDQLNIHTTTNLFLYGTDLPHMMVPVRELVTGLVSMC